MSLLGNTAIKKILSETQTWSASQNYEDDAKLLFGASAGDLEVYHDGTNSYIKEDGTGDLIFLVDNKIIFKDNDDSEEALWTFDTGGRTFTIGATDGNDDVATSFYGAVTFNDNPSIASTNLNMSNANPVIYFSSGNTAVIESNASLKFRLDKNNNGDNIFFVANGGDSTVFSMDESGNVTQSGYSLIDGEVIYFGGATDEAGRIKIDQTTTDEIKFVPSDGGGSSLGFALNSTTYPQIYSPSDSKILFGDHIVLLADKQVQFGNTSGGDATIEHDDTDFLIKNSKGDLKIYNDNSSGSLQTWITLDASDNALKSHHDFMIDGGNAGSNVARLKFRYNGSASDELIMYRQSSDFSVQSQNDEPIRFRYSSGTLKYDFSSTQFIVYNPISLQNAHQGSGTLDSNSANIPSRAHNQSHELCATADTLGGAYSGLSLLEKIFLKTIKYDFSIDDDHTIPFTYTGSAGNTYTVEVYFRIDKGGGFENIGFTQHTGLTASTNLTADFSTNSTTILGKDVTGDLKAELKVVINQTAGSVGGVVVTAYDGSTNADFKVTTSSYLP